MRACRDRVREKWLEKERDRDKDREIEQFIAMCSVYVNKQGRRAVQTNRYITSYRIALLVIKARNTATAAACVRAKCFTWCERSPSA